MIVDIPNTPFAAAFREVEDTTTVISPGRMCAGRYMSVPGYPKDVYVPFGMNDDLPYKIIDLVGRDEVTSQNKLFNALTCYGAGLHFFCRDEGGKEIEAGGDELEQFKASNNLPAYFLNQCTDVKYFYFTVTVLLLSQDGRKITRIRHKEAAYCRFAPVNRYGRIPYVYYADFQNGDRRKGFHVERIEVLDSENPLGDLRARLGVSTDGRMRKALPTKTRKFAVITKIPTVGDRYYPVPYWTSIFRGGSYDEKQLISVGKRAKLRNHTTVKYLVEIARDYWQRILDDERITDPEKAAERINREKANIRDFIAGIENSGKVWISGFYIDINGHECHDVKISLIERQKEGGEWSEDIQSTANTICYADNVHPNLVGAVPGKTQSNNSGSDKRELFTMKQALEIAFHDQLLQPLRIVIAFNGWKGVFPAVPMIQLTTLDKHRDAVIR